MDSEELEYFAGTGISYILTDIPEDGEEVLCINGSVDVFGNGGRDGCFWESGCDVEVGQKWISMSEVIKSIDDPCNS